MMDMEFKKLVDLLPNVATNTTAAQEHVGEIEQRIQVIKERARGTMNTLLFFQLPRLMIIELMHFCVVWMNTFPVKLGVSKKMEPKRTDLTSQARCQVTLQDSFWGIL